MYSSNILSSLYLSVQAVPCLCPPTGPDDDPPPLRLIPEERISFGINPAIATVTTVAQIREDYNEVDSRLIAKEVWRTLDHPALI